MAYIETRLLGDGTDYRMPTDSPETTWSRLENGYRAALTLALITGVILLLGGIIFFALSAAGRPLSFGSNSAPFFQALAGVFSLILTVTTGIMFTSARRITEVLLEFREMRPATDQDRETLRRNFRQGLALHDSIYLRTLLILASALIGLVVCLFYLAGADAPLSVDGSLLALALLFFSVAGTVHTLRWAATFSRIIPEPPP